MTETPKGNFATWLRAQMAAHGLSGREFADRLGVSTSAVSRWRSGQRLPVTTRAVTLAAALGVPVETIEELLAR